MTQFLKRLQREPTAVGTLIGTTLPALVVLGVLRLDDHAIAALVIVVNALVGFAVRTLVSPADSSDPPPG